jgi:hypothetical protein
MSWETLRNPNTPIAPSISDEYMVVPIMESPRVIGWAVVKIADLKPDFKTLREAQQWADSQNRGAAPAAPHNQPTERGKTK